MKDVLFCPKAPRCGAYARTTGRPCKKIAMANGRCRNHGGKSLKGIGSPRYKHGWRTKEAMEVLKEGREIAKQIEALLTE